VTDADRIAAIVRKAEDSCCNVTIDEIRWLADRAARPLTVGAALKDALSPAFVAEFFDCEDWWQFRVTIARRKKMTAAVEARWRHHRARGWSTWGQPFDWKRHPEMPARLVPLAEADANPATRGEMP
jgi:hypothetical protein